MGVHVGLLMVKHLFGTGIIENNTWHQQQRTTDCLCRVVLCILLDSVWDKVVEWVVSMNVSLLSFSGWLWMRIAAAVAIKHHWHIAEILK